MRKRAVGQRPPRTRRIIDDRHRAHKEPRAAMIVNKLGHIEQARLTQCNMVHGPVSVNVVPHILSALVPPCPIPAAARDPCLARMRNRKSPHIHLPAKRPGG
jgi:hypothetical protein